MEGSSLLLTARLRLRRLRPADEPDLVALDSDPEVMRYVGSPPGTRTPEETADRARQRISADHGPCGWRLVEGKDDGVFHGLGQLLPMPEGDDVEVGYRLARLVGQGDRDRGLEALRTYGRSSSTVSSDGVPPRIRTT